MTMTHEPAVPSALPEPDPTAWQPLLRALRHEAHDLLALVARPDVWEAPVAEGGRQARDIVAQLVHHTEQTFLAFDAARARGPVPVLPSEPDAAGRDDAEAGGLHATPRAELLARLRSDVDRMLGIAYELTDAEWTTLIVSHPEFGPLPAGHIPLVQLGDFVAQAREIRHVIGEPRELDAETENLLAPLGILRGQAV